LFFFLFFNRARASSYTGDCVLLFFGRDGRSPFFSPEENPPPPHLPPPPPEAVGLFYRHVAQSRLGTSSLTPSSLPRPAFPRLPFRLRLKARACFLPPAISGDGVFFSLEEWSPAFPSEGPLSRPPRAPSRAFSLAQRMAQLSSSAAHDVSQQSSCFFIDILFFYTLFFVYFASRCTTS